MKLSLLVLFAVIAAAAANPAANTEWRWKTRMPMLTPNPKALPFNRFVRTYVPKPRVPGTKAVPGCGGQKMTPRIVGGDEAVPHSYPWQVGLFASAGWFCGGSIINEEWILTAAHCVVDTASIDVVAGAHNIREAEPTQVTITSAELIAHADYGPFYLVNDIALIRLSEPLTFNEYIAPICLPSYSDTALPAGTIVNPSGWGKTSDASSAISDVLRETSNPVITVAECADVYGSITVTDSVICTDTTGATGTCNGDSGGPLNYNDNGVTYTRGITSFVASAGCESGLPDGFTRVIAYLDWIETNTGIAIDP